uniref:Uncharacterized protein n=1 Tax=Pristionchus pacificus TaxID=54126 RepID=A0A8R1V678_PRIPA
MKAVKNLIGNATKKKKRTREDADDGGGGTVADTDPKDEKKDEKKDIKDKDGIVDPERGKLIFDLSI